MGTAETVSLLGLAYAGYKLLEHYRKRKAQERFVAAMAERQAFVEEQMDKFYKQQKWARYFEFRRRLEDHVSETGDNPYLNG